jgi:hypothetical protein
MQWPPAFTEGHLSLYGGRGYLPFLSFLSFFLPATLFSSLRVELQHCRPV